jgi:hypothetical protein
MVRNLQSPIVRGAVVAGKHAAKIGGKGEDTNQPSDISLPTAASLRKEKFLFLTQTDPCD